MWVPSFLCAIRRLMGNAGPTGRASDDSAPPWLRKPGAQTPWWGGGWTPVCSSSTWAAGPIAGCFPSPVCQGPSFLVTVQISPSFSFHCKLQQKSQHATDSVHGVQWTFLRCSALWESLFAGASDLVQSHVVTWTSSTQTSAHKVGPTSRPFLKTCPWLCSGSNHLLSNHRRCHLSFPYALTDSWYYGLFL